MILMPLVHQVATIKTNTSKNIMKILKAYLNLASKVK